MKILAMLRGNPMKILAMLISLFAFPFAAGAGVLNGNIHQVLGGAFSPDGGKIFYYDPYDPSGASKGSVLLTQSGNVLEVHAVLCTSTDCRKIDDSLQLVNGTADDGLFVRPEGSRVFKAHSAPFDSHKALSLSVLGGAREGGYILLVTP